MRRYLGLVAVWSVAGCALLPSAFDNQEHAALVTLQQLSQDRTVCRDRPTATVVAAQLDTQAQWLVIYGSSLSSNQNLAEIESTVAAMSSELYARYLSQGAVSTLYCDTKLQNINNAAQQAVKVSGKRPRL